MTKDDWARLAHTKYGMPKADRAPPKSVHLVGLGPTHKEFLQLFMSNELPELVWGRDEIWTLNRGVYYVPHDVLFIMDHLQGEADSFPRYGERLWKHDRPIITSDNCEGWPGHVHRYPYREIMEWVNDRPHPPQTGWVTVSVPYIFMYAAWLGVEELFLWGIDYHYHTIKHVEEGKSNATYWERWLEELGINIHLPTSTTFLDMNNRDFYYGYKTDPRFEIEARRQEFWRLVKPNLELDL